MIGNAVRVMQTATGEAEEEIVDDGKDANDNALGAKARALQEKEIKLRHYPSPALLVGDRPAAYLAGMNRFYIPAEDPDGGSLLARLQEVARHGRTHYARHLLKTGLYAGQEKIIEALAANGPMTPGALAKGLEVRPPTVTKTISRLEEQGFVARAASKEDGRQVLVELTDAGRDVLGAMGKAIAKAEKQALKGLKKKERKQLEKILGKIEGNLVVREDPGQDDESGQN